MQSIESKDKVKIIAATDATALTAAEAMATASTVLPKRIYLPREEEMIRAAKRHVEKQVKKYGHPLHAICCEVCGKSGGTLVKTDEGKYRHQKKCK